MCDPIISSDAIRAKAQSDYAAGKGRDEHGFNWHAAAIETWQQEWDRCAEQQLEEA
jgi:hypothetical protein